MTQVMTRRNPHVGEVRFASLRLVKPTETETTIAVDKPEGYIAGWASTEQIDSYGTIIAPGAFSASIKDRGLRGARGVKLLCQHDRDRIAGVIDVLEYRNGRLWIEAQMNLAISYARDLWEAAKMNEGLAFSVGWYTKRYTYDETSDIVTYTEGDLFEVSVVTFASNPSADMTDIRSDDAPSIDATDAKSIDFDKPCKTMAKFEKRIVAMLQDLVATRRRDSGSDSLTITRKDARRFARVAKANAHLFKPDPTTLVVDATVTAPAMLPVVDDTLARAVAALRAARTVLEAGTGTTHTGKGTGQ